MLIDTLKDKLSSATRLPFTLYRYIWQEVSVSFLGGVMFFLFVLLMFQIIRLSDFLVVHAVPIVMVLKLIGYLTLTFLPIVIPIAFLLAVLVGFGRLSVDSELIAMRASGLSLYRLIAPILVQGLLISIINLMLNLYLVPWGNRMFRYETFRISNTKTIVAIKEGRFTEGFFDMVLFADRVYSHENRLERVFIYDAKGEDKLPISIVAKTGKIFNDQMDTKGVPGIVLRLFDGTLHRANPVTQLYEYIQFASYDIFLALGMAPVEGVEKPKTMDNIELKQRIALLQARKTLEFEQGRELRRLQVERSKRFALSFACLIFAVMGVGFGVVRTRTVRSNSLLICMLVMLGYWSLYNAGSRLGEEGYVPPVIAMWSANLILMIVSIFAIRKAAR